MPVRPKSVAVVNLGVLVPLLAGCSGPLSPSVGGVVPLPAELLAPVDRPAGDPAPLPALDGCTSLLPAGTPTAPVAARPTAAPPDLNLVRRQLTAQRYYGGALTGGPSAALRSAVMAFQKVNRLAVDGVVGPRTTAALAAPRTPVLRYPGPANRVDVDLTRQVLYVVRAGSLLRILPVSPGNGQSYVQGNGQVARALTPVGHYRITAGWPDPNAPSSARCMTRSTPTGAGPSTARTASRPDRPATAASGSPVGTPAGCAASSRPVERCRSTVAGSPSRPAAGPRAPTRRPAAQTAHRRGPRGQFFCGRMLPVSHSEARTVVQRRH